MKDIFLYISIFILFLTGCKKDISKPQWDVEVLTPLLKSEIGIMNIIPDSISTINSDSSISLVFSNFLYGMNLDDSFQIPDTSLSYTTKLDNINLDDISVSDRTSLGDIALNDQANGNGDLYTLIMNAHNTGTQATITPITQQNYTDLVVDATDYFQTISLEEGYIDISIDNQLPIDITNVILELKNEISGTVIVQDTFLIIPSFSAVTHTHSLAGKTVEGILLGNLIIESPGSTGDVTIDTSMAMITNITVRDIKISSATAIFPNQEIVNQVDETSLDNPNIQLTKTKIKSGFINIQVFNTIAENLSFDFELLSATKNGSSLAISGNIPAANGSASSYTTSKNLAGYDLNLQGIGFIEQTQGDLNGNGYIDPDTVNTFYQKLIGRIDSSGNLVTISLSDSIYILTEFIDIVPEYAEGYLGQMKFNETGSSDFEFDNIFYEANININQAIFSLSVRNQIGIESELIINELKASNTINNIDILLNTSSIANPFYVSKPYNPFSVSVNVIPSVTNLEINHNNSNITDLLNIYPDKLSYNVDITTNPNNSPLGNTNFDDFIYYGDSITTYLNAEIPLSIIAENLILSDTIDFDLSAEDIKDVNSGNLILYVDNGFPIQSKIQLYLINESNIIFDSLMVQTETIYAANINSLGKVDLPLRTKITIPTSNNKLNTLTTINKMIIRAEFKTMPNSTHVKLYDYYKMKFKIIADFNYKINQ